MNENAKAWVAALRSGEYQQARMRLRVGDAYCCLGVACELYRQETGLGKWDDTFFEGYGCELPIPVMKWLGLAEQTGGYGMGQQALTADNDTGKSFVEIADIIESEPEGLFAEDAVRKTGLMETSK